MGETHSTNRFSLELEVDRLRRDLARCEDDVERLKKEVDAREDRLREKELELDRLVSFFLDWSEEVESEVGFSMPRSGIYSTRFRLRDSLLSMPLTNSVT